jgi:cytochrome b subunit of formate dehydrogenase
MTTPEETKPTAGGQSPAVPSRGRLPYLAMLLGAAVLAVTGIGTFALGQPPMTHWVLIAHVSAAPLFAIGLALVALTWADRCRAGGDTPAKPLFWFILVCGLVVLLSGVVPMTPLFGTGGQHTLYLTHRYSAIALAAALALQLICLRRRSARP